MNTNNLVLLKIHHRKYVLELETACKVMSLLREAEVYDTRLDKDQDEFVYTNYISDNHDIIEIEMLLEAKYLAAKLTDGEKNETRKI